MTNPASPIADFYPSSFAIDMEGKRAEWEGVVLICFIDQDRLLAAERSIPQGSLTPEERARNKLGDMLVFTHDDSTPDTGAALNILLVKGLSSTGPLTPHLKVTWQA